MRYTSALLLGAAVLASAAESSDEKVRSCLENCGDDLNCKAHCVPVCFFSKATTKRLEESVVANLIRV